MDYVKPADVAKAMVETGSRKLALAPSDLLIRGMLSGAILGVATSLAFTGAVQTGQPLVGALIFPVGLVMIVLLGLELDHRQLRACAAAVARSRGQRLRRVMANWGWVFLGNLIGSVAYGALLAIALTNMGTIAPAGVAARIVADRRSQDDRLRGVRLRRHGHGVRQGDAVQLDGLSRASCWR